MSSLAEKSLLIASKEIHHKEILNILYGETVRIFMGIQRHIKLLKMPYVFHQLERIQEPFFFIQHTSLR